MKYVSIHLAKYVKHATSSTVYHIFYFEGIMVNVIFKYSDGTEKQIDIEDGLSIMEGAVKNNLDGIDADCGGACACATCHIYIDDAWRDKFDEPSASEEDMLDFAFSVKNTSRLSCQICVSGKHDGLVVHIPEKQF